MDTPYNSTVLNSTNVTVSWDAVNNTGNSTILSYNLQIKYSNESWTNLTGANNDSLLLNYTLQNISS